MHPGTAGQPFHGWWQGGGGAAAGGGGGGAGGGGGGGLSLCNNPPIYGERSLAAKQFFAPLGLTLDPPKSHFS